MSLRLVTLSFFLAVPVLVCRAKSYCMHNAPSSHEEAQSYCANSGMTLATIMDQTENGLAQEACGQRQCWLGLHEAAGEGSWSWISSDGASVALTAESYANWNSRHEQPGNDYGRNEHLGIMNAADAGEFDGTWFDAAEFGHAFALCESASDNAVCPQPECWTPVASQFGGVCQRACWNQEEGEAVNNGRQNHDVFCCATVSQMSCSDSSGGVQYKLIQQQEACFRVEGYVAYSYSCCPCEEGDTACQNGQLNGPGDEFDLSTCEGPEASGDKDSVGVARIATSIFACLITSVV